MYKHVLIFLMLVMNSAALSAHHVIGRYSYDVNEDSSSPPGQHVETQIGDYQITYRVFPAFVKPNEQGRINFYISPTQIGDGIESDVKFSVRESGLFKNPMDVLGVQTVDDNVYHQDFNFHHAGNYVVTADFKLAGEPYSLDFPLQVGSASTTNASRMIAGMFIFILLIAGLRNKQRLKRFRVFRLRERGEQKTKSTSVCD